MAFKLASLFVEIGANDSGLSQTLSAVRSKLTSLANMKFSSPAGGFAAILGGLGLGKIIHDSTDLETRMVALAKATDLSGPGLAAMKAQLIELSTSIKGVRLNDLIDIATTGAKMGVATGDLLKYAEGIAKVSTAIDDMPAGEIADRIGKLNTVFKLGVQGSMQLGSAIDKLADSGVSSASGILDVTARISGSAVAAKITAQEATALAAALLDTGTRSEEAASSLLDLIAALNQVQGRKGMAKTLGMDAKDFAATIRDKPIEAIQLFLAALGKLDAAGQIKTLEDVGLKGDTHAAEVMKLAQQSGTLGKYVGLANSEFKSLDQINKSYNATAETTAAKLAVMQNKLQVLGDTIGSAVLPPFNSFLTLVGDFSTGAIDAFGRVGAAALEWGADFSGVFELASAGFRNFADVVERTGLLIGQWMVAAWEDVAWGGEVVAAVAKYFWESFKEAFDITLVMLGNLRDNFVEILKEIWEAFKSGGTHVINVKFKGLMEGLDLKGDGQFRMPEQHRSNAVQDQIDALDQRIQDREDARGQKAFEAANKGKTQPGQATPTAAGAATAAVTKAGVTDLSSYARELQDGALKGSDIPKQQLNKLETISGTLASMLELSKKKKVLGAVFR